MCRTRRRRTWRGAEDELVAVVGPAESVLGAYNQRVLRVRLQVDQLVVALRRRRRVVDRHHLVVRCTARLAAASTHLQTDHHRCLFNNKLSGAARQYAPRRRQFSDSPDGGDLPYKIVEN